MSTHSRDQHHIDEDAENCAQDNPSPSRHGHSFLANKRLPTEPRGLDLDLALVEDVALGVADLDVR